MSQIVRSWSGVEWATEGSESQVYDVEEDDRGYIRWKRPDLANVWSRWAAKWEMDSSFIDTLEDDWKQRECPCSGYQLLWGGHLTECRYAK